MQGTASADGLHHHRVPAPDCLDHAARLIIDAAGKLPDLSDVVVILPQFFLAQPLSQRLARIGHRVLLLPRFATFASLAQGERIERAVMPHAQRQALLYDALRETRWFRASSLWSAADELLALIDELALHAPAATVADSAPASGPRLDPRAGAGRLLDMEAQLVERLAAALDGGRASERATLAPTAAYRAQLAHFRPSAAMFVVGIDAFNPVEAQFLERCARAQPVHVIASALRFEDSARAALLASAWPEASAAANVTYAALRERAHALARIHPTTPARDWLRLHQAPSLEAQAQAAVAQIQRWLSAGFSRIAIVAQDRLAARRVRALLERVNVLAQDEAGWRLSTTAASTVLMRWLDVLSADFAYREFMDLLSSPFVLPRSQQHSVIAGIDTAARKANWTRGLQELQRVLAQRASSAPADAATAAALARIADAAVVFLGDAHAKRISARHDLSRWLELLERSLHLLGVDRALAEDAAGQQLLERLAEQRIHLTQHSVRYTFAQMREWLSHDLESVYFRDDSIESPVVITALANMNLREFDAVAVVGADEEHLFGAPPAGFLNERQRAQLGLPTHAEHIGHQVRTLSEALLNAREVLFVWQGTTDGAPRAPSLLIERLRALHALSYGGEDLSDPSLRVPGSAGHQSALDLPPRFAPAPRPPSGLLPRRISAGAYQSLMTCPYQFHALQVLGLREGEQVREEMNKRDFGHFVHAVLHKFHKQHAQISQLARAEARAELIAIAEAALAQWQQRSALNRAWRVRWEALIEEYLDWQVQREAHGWRWREGEIERELELKLTRGGQVTLSGRIDRIDVQAHEGGTAFALVDYKTSSVSKLKQAQRRHIGEDVQLASYAALYREPVAQAEYLSVDKSEVAPVAVKNIAALAHANVARLRELFDALHGGAALPAQGLLDACDHCAARGLCRRDVWV